MADGDRIGTIFSRATALKFAYFGTAGFGTTGLLYAVSATLRIDLDIPITLLSLLSTAIGVVSVLIYSAAYLGVFGDDVPKTRSDLKAQMDVLRADLQSAIDKLNRIPAPKTDEQIAATVGKVFDESVRDSIESKLGGNVGEIAKGALLKEFAPNVFKDESANRVDEHASKYISGLHDQIKSQQKTANFNVWCGMLFAVNGIAAMGLFIYLSYLHPENRDFSWMSIMFFVVPKIAFVLLFESMSFFFLKAYRDDRNMMRYLRNEATNMESRFLGLSAAILFSDTVNITKAVESLMKTERNFTVKKGERLILDSLDKNDPIFIEALADKLVPAISSKLRAP